MAKNYFERILLIALLCCAFFSCNRDFKIITKPHPWARSFDTIVKEDTLTFQILNKDSLAGKYNFSVLPGFEGHALQLKQDSTFLEMPWSDVVRRMRSQRGKWKIEGEYVILKRPFKSIRLKIHQYSWATFLVPEGTEKKFAYEFNRYKATIDSMAATIQFQRTYVIEKQLNNLRTLCFIKRTD